MAKLFLGVYHNFVYSLTNIIFLFMHYLSVTLPVCASKVATYGLWMLNVDTLCLYYITNFISCVTHYWPLDLMLCVGMFYLIIYELFDLVVLWIKLKAHLYVKVSTNLIDKVFSQHLKSCESGLAIIKKKLESLCWIFSFKLGIMMNNISVKYYNFYFWTQTKVSIKINSYFFW